MDRSYRSGPYDTWSLVIVGAGLILVLLLHLLTALLGGLLVYELVHVLAQRLPLRRLTSNGARLVAVAVLATLIVAAVIAAVLALVAFFRSDAGGLTALMRKLAEIIETSRPFLPEWLSASVPADADELRTAAVSSLRSHAADVGSMGRGVARISIHLVLGMIIGAMIAVHEMLPDEPLPPMAAALLERSRRLADAFRRVVFAQVRIAAINAVLTGVFLTLVLPLAGVHLPYAKTLVLVTFVCGLIPVIGNLVSNTVIVLVSLSHSFQVALAALGFLVVIHKLEYFLNARIVGTRIRARAWELLIAMLVMETAFGLGGLAAAPIYYAYLKDELSDRGVL